MSLLTKPVVLKSDTPTPLPELSHGRDFILIHALV